MGVVFLQPGFGLVLPAALVLFALWRLLAPRRYVAWSTLRLIDPALARPSRTRALPRVLVALALGLLSLALMEPVLPLSETQVRSQGLDIALVLDLSSSMQEVMGVERPPRSLAGLTFSSRDRLTLRPVGKTRLETTKAALRDFIARRHDDRIALIVFSDHAYVVSPLTFDYDSLQRYVSQVDEQSLRGEGMTAIGDGIGLANHLLARQAPGTRRNGVILVFTDGEHNAGRDPIEVLSESDGAGFRVHLVGVDLEQEVHSKPAVRRLIDAVRAHGGRYFDTSSERELRAASAAIDTLEKGLLTSKVYVRQAPVFRWFALPGGVLIVAGLGIRAVPYFADYT